MAVFILLLVLCLGIPASVTADPCLTYENFTADSTRSPSHVESVYNNKNCDAVLTEKWYRLIGDAGTDLTNDSSVLVSGGCGTQYQLWMNDTMPDVSEGTVDRKICMTSPFSNCHSSFTVQVKNCCSFRVYNLKSATSCPQAYCVSPSSVPPLDCPTTTSTTAGTTTTAEDTTTSVSTTTETTTQTTSSVPTTTTTTTRTTATKTKTRDKHVTVVNTISTDIIITVVVLLVVITVILIGTAVYKSYKCSKVDTEKQSAYFTPVQYYTQNAYMEICNPAQVVEKGGFNNSAPANTRHM
ncbi:cell wall integrity and stress response component 2-like [Mizuhopecten yessoensis]|uniref:Uromodulin n=1 Tax=Mizuhopecten yessoensis TaxID=6573 RepID=A0A210PT47_MIZYE|nr:cell wall integrity and stress response component 2-like [Mizuhopecten yessoensis]OWF39667.1 Uromodulin [Mizuhopecten yessoensis]